METTTAAVAMDASFQQDQRYVRCENSFNNFLRLFVLPHPVLQRIQRELQCFTEQRSKGYWIVRSELNLFEQEINKVLAIAKCIPLRATEAFAVLLRKNIIEVRFLDLDTFSTLFRQGSLQPGFLDQSIQLLNESPSNTLAIYGCVFWRNENGACQSAHCPRIISLNTTTATISNTSSDTEQSNVSE